LRASLENKIKNTAEYVCSSWAQAGMGEIGKQSQLHEKKKYGAVQELSFSEIRWILKFSFKHYFMNKINIFLIG
jgi:hypothetical protein